MNDINCLTCGHNWTKHPGLDPHCMVPGCHCTKSLIIMVLDNLVSARKWARQLKQWVDDLQSGWYINCVYCGHRYAPNPKGEFPVSMADVLREHIEQCPEHPMSKLKTELEKITAERNEAIKVAIKGGEEMKEKKAKIVQGWECPKCGSVYAIWVSSCPICQNSNIKIVTTNTTEWAHG